MSEQMIKVEYLGGGAFFHGIPARDLTAEEWMALGDDAQKLVKGSEHYKVLPKAKKVQVSAEDEKDGG